MKRWRAKGPTVQDEEKREREREGVRESERER